MRTTIFAEQTLAFAYNSDYGAYGSDSAPSLFVPVDLETYIIVWDGTEYTSTAFTSSSFPGMVLVGNTVVIGGENTGEPFAIASIADGSGMTILALDASETHTLAVFQEKADEEPEEPEPEEPAGVSIVLYDRSGEPVTYEGVETITTDTPTAGEQATFTHGVLMDGVEIELDMAAGDQALSVPDGYLIKKATLKKPETLMPQYIKKNIEIGGVVGEFIGDGVQKTVALDMAEGDQSIVADAGTVMGEVVVQKPETLIPENILKDIDIGGVIGTLEVGGLKGISVTVVDYDGSIIEEKVLQTGATYELPEVPTHERLVFDGWSSSAEIVNNTITVGKYDIIVGAMYHTVSGATEVDIELNAVTGLTFGFNSVLTGYTSIDWGDGAVNTSLTHTYADYGSYTVKIYGMTKINSSSTSKTFTTSAGQKCVKGVHLASTVTAIASYAFYNHIDMEYITLPVSVTDMYGVQVFYSCRQLKCCIIPSSVPKIRSSYFYGCYSMVWCVLPFGLADIFDTYAFYCCFALKSIVIPSGVTKISSNAFAYCHSMEKCTIPVGSMLTIGDNAFQYCTLLKRCDIPSGVTSIGQYAFQYCYALEEINLPTENTCTLARDCFGEVRSAKGTVIIPEGSASAANSLFSKCYGVEKFVIPSTYTTINSGAFDYCHSCMEYDFTKCTSVVTLSASTNFRNISAKAKIKVPAALYDEWIAATYWTSVAGYIVAS